MPTARPSMHAHSACRRRWLADMPEGSRVPGDSIASRRAGTAARAQPHNPGSLLFSRIWRDSRQAREGADPSLSDSSVPCGRRLLAVSARLTACSWSPASRDAASQRAASERHLEKSRSPCRVVVNGLSQGTRRHTPNTTVCRRRSRQKEESEEHELFYHALLALCPGSALPPLRSRCALADYKMGRTIAARHRLGQQRPRADGDRPPDGKISFARR